MCLVEVDCSNLPLQSSSSFLHDFSLSSFANFSCDSAMALSRLSFMSCAFFTVAAAVTAAWLTVFESIFVAGL